MARARTAIEWTERTWNPTTGCTKVSPGCKHCYAERIARRFPHRFPHGFRFTLRPDRLDEPRRWRKPSLVFVNSMSDLFHEEMPLDFLKRVFQVMRETPQHLYQVLTKRHERLVELAPALEPWPENVWIGVSVENARYQAPDRLPQAGSREGSLHFLRAPDRPDRRSGPDGNPLDHRQRRVGTKAPPASEGVGARAPGPSPGPGGGLLLQAVGRALAAVRGAGARGRPLGGDARPFPPGPPREEGRPVDRRPLALGRPVGSGPLKRLPQNRHDRRIPLPAGRSLLN